MKNEQYSPGFYSVIDEAKGHKHRDRKWLKDNDFICESMWPRYVPAYRFIQEACPNFYWEAHEKVVEGLVTKLTPSYHNYPTLCGKKYSLASVIKVIQFVREHNLPMPFDNFPEELSAKLQPILQLGDVGNALVAMIAKLEGIIPHEVVVQSIAEWLKQAKSGVPSTIVMNVCPDYSHENGKYTFKGLGEGIGFVAQKAIEILPDLHKLIIEQKLNVRLVIAMADIEAENPANLRSVNETFDNFVMKSGKSLQAIKRAVPDYIPVEYIMLGLLPHWKLYKAQALEEIRKGHWTGVHPFSEAELEKAIVSRTGLYTRQYSLDVNAPEALADQAAEYAGVCVATEERYPNVFYIGVDSPAMAIFMQALCKVIRAILYIKQIDY